MFRKKKKDGGAETVQEVLAPDKDGTLPAKTNAGQPLIKVEPLSLDELSEEDEREMLEITDSSVLARIDNIIPGFAQATVSGATAIQSAKAGGEVLYRAILPEGQKLAASQDKVGMFRGFWKNGSKIGGHANFEEVVQKGGGMVAANAVNAAMSVASVVVGQYYMSRIDGKLEKINEDLAEIIDFLNNEYRGRLDSLLNHIRTLTTFEAEILENEEQRNSKIAQLNDLEMKCTQMLSQADRTLENFTKRTDWDFDEYVDEVKKIHRWFNYQKALYIMLCQLANLKFALFKGTMSREQCTAMVTTYSEEIQTIGTALREWHEKMFQRLNINIDEKTVKRAGLDYAIHLVPQLFHKSSKYKKIDDKLAGRIIQQSAEQTAQEMPDTTDLYAQDVQIVARDGKLYYLPAQSA